MKTHGEKARLERDLWTSAVAATENLFAARSACLVNARANIIFYRICCFYDTIKNDTKRDTANADSLK